MTDRAQEIDMTQWLNRFALEAIGRGGMGHSFGKMSDLSKYSEATRELAYECLMSFFELTDLTQIM